MSKPTARELDTAADVACDAFWRWVRAVDADDESPELWDAACDAMNRLTGIVERRATTRKAA